MNTSARWLGVFGSLAMLAVACVQAPASVATPPSGAEPPMAGPGSRPSTARGGADEAGYGPGPAATMAPTPPPPSDAERSEAPSAATRQAEKRDRPGLGTEWGETRSSRITQVPFERVDGDNPFVTGAFYYNDEEGVRAMTAGNPSWRSGGRSFPLGSGSLTIGLRDERRGLLPGLSSGGRSYFVGEAGRRYTIVVRNDTSARFEIVLSVDGLDVLDGRAASPSKRGYLVAAHSELEVDGFRQSTEEVAAFRFGSVRDSYAGRKYGDTRNVGVIGAAVFRERGAMPWPWTPAEVERRLDADPFPGRFATPPN